MKLEELKKLNPSFDRPVELVSSDGTKIKILSIFVKEGNVCANIMYPDSSCTWQSVSSFLRNYSLPKKEPKKLGRLFMCIKPYDSMCGGFKQGEVSVIQDAFSVDTWQPITIDENGNVFELEK